MRAELGVMLGVPPSDMDLFLSARPDIVRMIPTRELAEWSAVLPSAGIKRLVVLRNELVAPVEALADDDVSTAHLDVADLFGDIEYVEVGNEWDAGDDSPASTQRSASLIAQDISRAWTLWPNAQIVTGGVLRGKVDVVNELLAALSWQPNATPERMAALIIGLHAYAVWPPGMILPGDPSLARLIGDFARAFGNRLAVTEIGIESKVEDDGAEQAEYVSKSLSFLCSHPAVRVAVHYQWSDYPSSEEGPDGIVTMGLVDIGGAPKPALGAFRAVATQLMSAPIDTSDLRAPVQISGQIGASYLQSEPVFEISAGNIPELIPGGDTMGQKIEDFERAHKAKLGERWSETPNIRVLAGTAAKPTARIAGYSEHVLVEIDGVTWPLKQDDSFFVPG